MRNDMKLEELKSFYGKIGQILDGLWFLEVEKVLGFEKAYEIDEAVWKVFPRKEAKRLQRLLRMDNVRIEDVPVLLDYSIFNSSLEFQTEIIYNDIEDKKAIGLKFLVSKCKTLDGMVKVGRSKDQIAKICEGVGLVFFESFLEPFFSNIEIRCTSCPFHPEKNSLKYEEPPDEEDGGLHNEFKPKSGYVCEWEFLISNIGIDDNRPN